MTVAIALGVAVGTHAAATSAQDATTTSTPTTTTSVVDTSTTSTETGPATTSDPGWIMGPLPGFGRLPSQPATPDRVRPGRARYTG